MLGSQLSSASTAFCSLSSRDMMRLQFEGGLVTMRRSTAANSAGNYLVLTRRWACADAFVNDDGLFEVEAGYQDVHSGTLLIVSR